MGEHHAAHTVHFQPVALPSYSEDLPAGHATEWATAPESPRLQRKLDEEAAIRRFHAPTSHVTASPPSDMPEAVFMGTKSLPAHATRYEAFHATPETDEDLYSDSDTEDATPQRKGLAYAAVDRAANRTSVDAGRSAQSGAIGQRECVRELYTYGLIWMIT